MPHTTSDLALHFPYKYIIDPDNLPPFSQSLNFVTVSLFHVSGTDTSKHIPATTQFEFPKAAKTQLYKSNPMQQLYKCLVRGPSDHSETNQKALEHSEITQRSLGEHSEQSESYSQSL